MKKLKWLAAGLLFLIFSCVTTSQTQRLGVYSVTGTDYYEKSLGYVITYFIHMTPNIEKFHTTYYFKKDGEWVESFSGTKYVDQNQAEQSKVSVGIPDAFWVNMLVPVKMKVRVYKPEEDGYYKTRPFEHIFKLDEFEEE